LSGIPFIAWIAFLVWLLFLGGAERLDHSWLTESLYLPGMTVVEIKVWGTLAAIALFITTLFVF